MRPLILLAALALAGCDYRYEPPPPPPPLVEATDPVPLSGQVTVWSEGRQWSGPYNPAAVVSTAAEGQLLRYGGLVLSRSAACPDETTGPRQLADVLASAKKAGANRLLAFRVERYHLTSTGYYTPARTDGIGSFTTTYEAVYTRSLNLELALTATLHDLASGRVLWSASTSGTYQGDTQKSVIASAQALVDAMVAQP